MKRESKAIKTRRTSLSTLGFELKKRRRLPFLRGDALSRGVRMAAGYYVFVIVNFSSLLMLNLKYL